VTRRAHRAHLARRFFASLRPGGPSPPDEAWVAGILSDGELALWRRMSPADRRHAVGVARRTEEAVGPEGATRSLLAAALMHDVGKVVSALGPFRRAAATVAGRSGPRLLGRRAREYLEHDRIGALMLEEAGSDPLTVTWAREHHLPPERWSVPPTTAQALKQADDD
jgi:hypothetical protein